MIIALENIHHDGVHYGPNDLIKGIYKKDAERLVNLKVARFVDEVPEEADKEVAEIDFKEELDAKFNATDLKEVAGELKIEFPGNISKMKLIDLIIELEKAEKALNFEVVEE